MQLTRKCLTLPTALDVWACLTLQLTIPSADVGLQLHLHKKSFRAWFCLLQYELVHQIIQPALCLPDADFNDSACPCFIRLVCDSKSDPPIAPFMLVDACNAAFMLPSNYEG